MCDRGPKRMYVNEMRRVYCGEGRSDVIDEQFVLLKGFVFFSTIFLSLSR